MTIYNDSLILFKSVYVLVSFSNSPHPTCQVHPKELRGWHGDLARGQLGTTWDLVWWWRVCFNIFNCCCIWKKCSPVPYITLIGFIDHHDRFLLHWDACWSIYIWIYMCCATWCDIPILRCNGFFGFFQLRNLAMKSSEVLELIWLTFTMSELLMGSIVEFALCWRLCIQFLTIKTILAKLL